MKTIGFHPRLFFTAFLLICMTTVILDVVGVHITRNFMYKRFNDRIDFLANYLALNAEVSVLMGDRDRLNLLASNLLGEEDVARVIVLDGQNEKLVDVAHGISGPLLVVAKPVLFKMNRGENIVFQDMRSPSGRGSHNAEDKIGEVKIAYTTSGVEALLREITIKYIWFSIGLSFISGLVFYFVSHPMVREVKQLAYAARHVGRGDLELRVRPGKIPETRSLAIDFNAMLDSLNTSREALDRVNREMIKQKSLAEVGKFSMMVAHEVKNPLSIIKSSLDILKKDTGLSSENMMVAYMEDEIRRLNRLIEDFLSFARPIKPVFCAVDLNDMMRSLVDRFKIMMKETNVIFQTMIPDAPAVVSSDSDLLVRGIGNILKNACEAVGEKGSVTVLVIVEYDQWVTEVADSGEGIDSDKLQSVFEPFYTSRATGTGLGLAYTRQVVEAHGGVVTARNADEGGAVFRLEIPIKRNPSRSVI